MRRAAIFVSSFLPLLLTAGLPPSSAGTRAAGDGGALRAELRGNDNRRPVFRENYRGGIHFLLFAQSDGVRIFQEWCSWGYFTRWFSARPLEGQAKQYVIKRSQNKVWTKNFPATHQLKKGEFIITYIDLCDGNWTVEPDLPQEDLEFSVVGHLEIGPDKETSKQRVWTGKLSTRPIEIVMGADCAAKLNATK